jgi:hypothetical protein
LAESNSGDGLADTLEDRAAHERAGSRVFVVASGLGRDAPQTRGLLTLADELRFTVCQAEPSTEVSRAGCTLVLMDLLSVDPSARARPLGERWIKAGGEALVICGSRDEPRTSGPAYQQRLHPREQLRALAFRGFRDRLARFYAEHPDQYAADRSDKPSDFDEWLNDQATSHRGGELEPRTLWREAMQLVLGDGGLRELAELLVLPDLGGLRLELMLEAATCVAHCRHPWWERGAQLPSRALLAVDPDANRTSADAPLPELAWLADVQVYLPPALAGAPRLAFTDGMIEDAHATRGSAPKWKSGFVKRFDPDKGITQKGEDKLRARNKHLAEFLGRLLLAGRPLRHAGCTLFLPFDPGEALTPAFRNGLREVTALPADKVYEKVYGPGGSNAGADSASALDELQAQLYFLPELRALLYRQQPADAADQDGSPALREWRLADEHIAGWQLAVQPGADGDAVAANVTHVHLCGYYNGTFVLAIGLAAPPLPEPAWALDSEDDDWWHPLVLAEPAVFELLRGRQLETWLGFARLARVVYPSFLEQAEERKIATLHLHRPGRKTIDFAALRRPDQGLALEPPRLSPILCALLLEFVPAQDGLLRSGIERWGDLHDDRLFSQLIYALAGPPLPSGRPARSSRPATRGKAPAQAADDDAENDAKRVFALALFGDRFADITDGCDGHAYDPVWVRAAVDNASLGLWDAAGVYIGCTEATNVYLGSGDYFARTVARRHVPYAYQRMLLQALFYQAALRRFNRQIGAATRALVQQARTGSGGSDFTSLRERFIEFTNLCWFRELTGQLQGKALFALQQRALGLEAEYALLKDEMERADEYMEARRNERFARGAEVVGFAGLVLALVAIWATVMAFVPLDGSIGNLVAAARAETLWPVWLGRALALLGLAILPPLLLALALRPLLHAWLKRFLSKPPGT